MIVPSAIGFPANGSHGTRPVLPASVAPPLPAPPASALEAPLCAVEQAWRIPRQVSARSNFTLPSCPVGGRPRRKIYGNAARFGASGRGTCRFDWRGPGARDISPVLAWRQDPHRRKFRTRLRSLIGADVAQPEDVGVRSDELEGHAVREERECLVRYIRVGREVEGEG